MKEEAELHRRVRELEQENRRLKALLARDDTSRTRMEQERERLLTALEQAHDTITVTDPEGCIVYVNPAVERLTGYSQQELLGQNPRILKSGQQSDQFYENLWTTLSAGQVWRGRIINRRKDGTLFQEEGSIAPVRDDSGQVVNYVAVRRDVTREVELERQLAQSQKMEAVGTLAGGIAHDVNNILCPILGYAELLLLGADNPEEVRFNANQIKMAANLAADVVKQVLTFCQPDKGVQTSIHLKPVIEEGLRLLRGSLPAHIELVEDLSNCSPVKADPTQVHQLLMNLATNAQHALNGCVGQIEVSLREIQGPPGSETTCGDYALLSVKDDGPGMVPAVVDRIFDPYFTTKAAGRGTGLGLATVRSIVDAHQGKVEVLTAAGSGAQFDIYLPLSRGEGVAAPEEVDSLPLGQERIMVIDDESSILMLEERGLKKLGYSVRGFQESLDALAAFQEAPDSFDAVVTDQSMPNLGGVELATQMLALRPGLPVVLLRGFTSRMTTESLKTLGIKGHLSKPTTPTAIARVLREIFDTTKTD